MKKDKVLNEATAMIIAVATAAGAVAGCDGNTVIGIALSMLVIAKNEPIHPDIVAITDLTNDRSPQKRLDAICLLRDALVLINKKVIKVN